MTASLETLRPGALILGLDPSGPAEILSVTQFGSDAVSLVFRANGRVSERLVFRWEEQGLQLVEPGRALAFDGEGTAFRLAAEAQRLRLAYLFDPFLAVSTAQIEPLPHQIIAVYGEMLPRQPLRFLLADDPGAGKTIMAGLLIKELMIRGDLERCLIVAPGGLVEQWQDELAEKFELSFEILTRDQIEATRSGNPFVEKNRLIVRLDMAARSDELQAKLKTAPQWDLVICDEAHRMAASYFGGEVKKTKRYRLGELLGSRTRNFLLMSATPHNGKEADFQLFMALLDADRDGHGRRRRCARLGAPSDRWRRVGDRASRLPSAGSGSHAPVRRFRHRARGPDLPLLCPWCGRDRPRPGWACRGCRPPGSLRRVHFRPCGEAPGRQRGICPARARGCAARSCRPGSARRATGRCCAAAEGPGCARRSRLLSARPPPVPSAAARQSRSSHARTPARRSSPEARQGRSSHRSSRSVPGRAVRSFDNPTLLTDHRDDRTEPHPGSADRSLRCTLPPSPRGTRPCATAARREDPAATAATTPSRESTACTFGILASRACGGRYRINHPPRRRRPRLRAKGPDLDSILSRSAQVIPISNPR